MTPRDATRHAVLEAALHWPRQGWAVFPAHSIEAGRCSCGGDCGTSAAKHPRTPHGLLDATMDAATIQAWWTRWPEANLALPTGRVNAIFAVDVDAPKGGPAALRALETRYGPLPRTVMQRTGSVDPVSGERSFQQFFQCPDDGIPNSVSSLGPGLDVRGDGGYVIIPPSRHRSGLLYEWPAGLHPDDLPIAPAPAWLLQHIRTPAAASNGQASPSTSEDWAALLQGASLGKRHHVLLRIAGHYLGLGIAAAEVEEILLGVAARCQPPHDAADVRRVVRDLAAKDAARAAAPSERAAGAPAVEVAMAVQLSTVTPTRVDWVWSSRLARGKLTVVSGDPGLGKSLVLLDMGARVSVRAPWPDRGGIAPLGSVVLLSAEDGIADTILPRWLAAGGDPSRAHVLQAVRTGDRELPFDLTRDLGALERLVTELGDVVLVGVDPVSAYFGKTDSHKDGSMRGVLLPLAAMAERQHVAVVAISHLNKETKENAKKALYRTTGSIALVAAARMAFIVAPHPEAPDRRVLVHQKNNLAPVPPTLGFRLVAPTDVVQVAWDADPVPDLTADAVLAPDAPDAQQPDAESFLTQLLADGPVPAEDGLKQAQSLRLSESTVWRARHQLGVEAKRFDDRWWWVPAGWPWPPGPKNSPPKAPPPSPVGEFLNSCKAPPPQGSTPIPPCGALEALQQQHTLTPHTPPKAPRSGDPPRARGLVAVPTPSYLHQVMPTEGAG